MPISLATQTAAAESLYRQSARAVQMVTLIVALAPAVPVPWSAAVAAFGLVALSASFFIDVAWLAGEARRAR